MPAGLRVQDRRAIALRIASPDFLVLAEHPTPFVGPSATETNLGESPIVDGGDRRRAVG